MARLLDGDIVTEKETDSGDFFARPLSIGERKRLSAFSSLRYFVQIVQLADRVGFTSELFIQGKEALEELASYLPLDEKQLVLFVLRYIQSGDEGCDVPVK